MCIKGNSCRFLHIKGGAAISSHDKEGTVDAAAKKSELPDKKGNLYVVVVCEDAYIITLFSLGFLSLC